MQYADLDTGVVDEKDTTSVKVKKRHTALGEKKTFLEGARVHRERIKKEGEEKEEGEEGILLYRFSLDLTRFNKIAISNNKFQMASGQGSHWLIESPTIFSSMCSPHLSDICQFYF